MSSTKITSVTFEHHPSGLGVNYARPRLSWRFSSHSQDFTNWFQTSYDVQIGGTKSDHYDEYHVEGAESVLVPWPGPALKSRESAWVKVRSHGTVVDPSGRQASESTPWSEVAFVEAALLDRNDWAGTLVTSPLAFQGEGPTPTVLFRRTFSTPPGSTKILKARLYITAHGVYRAYVNGHWVGRDEMAPGWTSYSHRLTYQVIDVASSLTADTANVLGVEVADGWFAGRLGWKGRRCVYGDRLGFLAQLEVSFDDGQSITVTSDGKWKSTHSAISRSEIYDGEHYDSRVEQVGWDSDCLFDTKLWLDANEAPFPSARLLTSDSPPVRAVEELKPVKIWTSPSGHLLIDFGQNLTGKLSVRLPVLEHAISSGHEITFSHAEVLERGELCTRPLRTAKPIDTIILSPKQPETWSPKFTFHGFRYVQVNGWPAQLGMPTEQDITALVLHSDMTRTGWFSCSEPLVNKLHENTVWSMKGNFLSIPTDCPQRDERLGWTGDIQVFAPSASFLYNISGFMGSWLADLSAEQFEDGRHGVPPMVVPDVLELPADAPNAQCAWDDVTVLTPWDLYNAFGDVEVLRSQYASMKTWVDQGIPRSSNGLWDQNAWNFGDWLDPTAPPDQPGKAATDCILVADAYLYRVLVTISKVSEVLGESDDASRYAEEALKIKAAFQHEYVTPAGLLACDTQTAHALAIAFKLFDSEQQIAKSADRLIHLVHSAKFRIATGFVGTPIMTHALSETGNHQLAYRMLLERQCPSWLYPITMGATTIWERWDSMLPDGSINPGTMTSFNHYALGSVINWLHKDVAGISPLEPGWRKFKVQPIPGGTFTHATAKYDSPYGRIECSWNIDEQDGTFHLSLTVPPNTRAVIVLPSGLKKRMADAEDGQEVGSGLHTFSCSFEQDEWPPRAKLRRSTFSVDTGSA